MHRRTLLAAASGALAAFAGCSYGAVREDRPPTDLVDPSTDSPTQSRGAPTTEPPTADGPEISNASPAASDLALTDLRPVAGTNVNLGATGTAVNDSGRWLTDCELVVTGRIGDERFTATAARNWLAPQRDWEWTIPFGEDAAAAGDDVELLSVEKRANYWQ